MFYKDVDLKNRLEMIEFLTKHFRYNTMNSWNRMTSYANNVKIYCLGLDDTSKAYDFLNAECESYTWDVDDAIRDFEIQTGYTAAFNGRSSGYIVMYDTACDSNGVTRAMFHGIDEYEDFEDWHTADIVKRVKLVQEFDKLCDRIREIFIDYVNKSVIKTVPVQRIEYKTIAVYEEDTVSDGT